MASNIKVDIVRPTATNGSLSLKGDSGGSATTNGVTVDSSGDTSITGQLDVDNININGNTISSTDTNGNILITPDGSGDVTVGTTPTINRISGASGNPLFGLVDKSIEVVGSTDTQNYRTGIAFGAAGIVGSGIYANNVNAGADEDTNLEFYTTKEGLTDARLAMTIDEDRNVTIVGSVSASSLTLNGVSNQGFPSGTKMLFQQTAAPTGWTKDTGSNDVALRVVSGTVGSGGSVAFETAFASQTIDTHTLDVTEIPAHNHSIKMLDGTPYSPSDGLTSAYHLSDNSTIILDLYSYNGTNSVNLTNGTNNTGGGLPHGHGSINLDVSYVDVIIATKD